MSEAERREIDVLRRILFAIGRSDLDMILHSMTDKGDEEAVDYVEWFIRRRELMQQ